MGILRSDVVSHSQLTAANASVLFDGSDSSGGSTGLRTADGNYGYAIGNENESITIECWIYNTSVSQSFDAIFATNTYGVSGTGLILYNNNDGLYMSGTGMASDYTEYGILEANTWYHIAFVKEKSQVRLYLDGVCKAYRETTSDFADDQLCIGCSNYGSGFPTYSFAGYISNFRINKRALYKTDKFTVPKFKLKNIPGTTLLCCQDASDDTTAAVGSITAGGTPVPGGFGPDLKEDTTDTGVVFEDNTKFDTLSYMVPPGGTTAESNRGRGVIVAGENPSVNKSISYVEMQSGGIAKDFGDLTKNCGETKAVGSSTRGVIHLSGDNPATRDTLEYITFATTSNSTDFGDLDSAWWMRAAGGNNTRGIFAGGLYPGSTFKDEIEYITIASAGNGTDFGNLTTARNAPTGCASPTRMVVAGGQNGPATSDRLNIIDYVTIATTGNATDFGDLTVVGKELSSFASSTRGVFGPRLGNPAIVNTIDYVTIATLGNASDFGDGLTARGAAASLSNSIRGAWAGGYTPSLTNSMEYITIESLGNAKDFGDLTYSEQYAGGCSDSHGGLS